MKPWVVERDWLRAENGLLRRALEKHVEVRPYGTDRVKVTTKTASFTMTLDEWQRAVSRANKAQGESNG